MKPTMQLKTQAIRDLKTGIEDVTFTLTTAEGTASLTLKHE